MSLLVPTVAALGGACIYGVTGALQQRATRRVVADPLDQRAFVRGLIRQPVWLMSTLGSLAGFALQGVALATGPLVLVQPLLVTGVLFAAVTGILLGNRMVDWVLMGALVMTAGGLGIFLVAGQPTQGGDVLTAIDVIPLAIALTALLTGCFWLALRSSGTARALSLALAAGIVYGVTAAIAKVTIGLFSDGLFAVVSHWSLWTVAVLGPAGFLLNQHAFRAGVIAAPVVAVITVTDPLVGIGIGLLWLGETVRADGLAVVGEVLGLLIMAAGVWLVAHRTPHLCEEPEQPARGAATVGGRSGAGGAGGMPTSERWGMNPGG